MGDKHFDYIEDSNWKLLDLVHFVYGASMIIFFIHVHWQRKFPHYLCK